MKPHARPLLVGLYAGNWDYLRSIKLSIFGKRWHQGVVVFLMVIGNANILVLGLVTHGPGPYGVAGVAKPSFMRAREIGVFQSPKDCKENVRTRVKPFYISGKNRFGLTLRIENLNELNWRVGIGESDRGFVPRRNPFGRHSQGNCFIDFKNVCVIRQDRLRPKLNIESYRFPLVFHEVRERKFSINNLRLFWNSEIVRYDSSLGLNVGCRLLDSCGSRGVGVARVSLNLKKSRLSNLSIHTRGISGLLSGSSLFLNFPIGGIHAVQLPVGSTGVIESDKNQGESAKRLNIRSPMLWFWFGLLNIAAAICIVVAFAIFVSFDRWRRGWWWGLARCIGIWICVEIGRHLIWYALSLLGA
jgi:hypothetical protein